MFKLDIELVRFVYNSCDSLGKCFGFGAMEGLCMYSGLIVCGVLSGLNMGKRGKK